MTIVYVDERTYEEGEIAGRERAGTYHTLLVDRYGVQNRVGSLISCMHTRGICKGDFNLSKFKLLFIY